MNARKFLIIQRIIKIQTRISRMWRRIDFSISFHLNDSVDALMNDGIKLEKNNKFFMEI